MSTWLQTLGHRERVPGYRHWDTGNEYLATNTGIQGTSTGYRHWDTGNEYLATDTGTWGMGTWLQTLGHREWVPGYRHWDTGNEYLATDTGDTGK